MLGTMDRRLPHASIAGLRAQNRAALRVLFAEAHDYETRADSLSLANAETALTLRGCRARARALRGRLHVLRVKEARGKLVPINLPVYTPPVLLLRRPPALLRPAPPIVTHCLRLLRKHRPSVGPHDAPDPSVPSAAAADFLINAYADTFANKIPPDDRLYNQASEKSPASSPWHAILAANDVSAAELLSRQRGSSAAGSSSTHEKFADVLCLRDRFDRFFPSPDKKRQ